jgi:hypothetical protein
LKKLSAFRTEVLPWDDPAAAGRWDTLLEASEQRSPFAARSYARHTAGLLNLSAALHFVAGPERDEAGALVFWRKRGPLREALIPPFTAFTPFLFREPPGEADAHQHHSPFGALLAHLEAEFDVLRFHLDPSTTDLRPARWRSWRAAPLYTYRQRLAPAEVLLAAWSASARRTFRQAGGSFRIEESAGAIADAARLCSASYERSGRSCPLPEDRLAAWITALHHDGMARAFSATPNGTGDTDTGAASAAVAFLHDGRTAYYWVAGSKPGPAMTVLLGTVLPRLHKGGIETFDWVGANTPSIAEFKRRFGPTLTPYFRIEKIKPAALRLYQAWRDG